MSSLSSLFCNYTKNISFIRGYIAVKQKNIQTAIIITLHGCISYTDAEKIIRKATIPTYILHSEEYQIPSRHTYCTVKNIRFHPDIHIAQ